MRRPRYKNTYPGVMRTPYSRTSVRAGKFKGVVNAVPARIYGLAEWHSARDLYFAAVEINPGIHRRNRISDRHIAK